MSRIHEALKRAEEEKTAAKTNELPSPASLEANISPAGGGVMEPAPLPVMSAGALTYEALLARCPRSSWKPDAKRMLFFDPSKHHERGMEEFRTLRSRLYQIREKRLLKTVMVASALPAEGKTFVAANLSLVLARQHGRRVILVDADLRRSQLHVNLGAAPNPGLAEYLLGEADEYAVIQRGSLDNLFFIPGGKMPSNPSELIANGRLKTLLQRLSAAFDWVIIDSPPAIPVSDASRMAELCDGVLLVLLAAKTPFDMAQRAHKEFHNMPVLGVVLNRVAPRDTYTSYYYYGKPAQKGKS